MRLFYAPVGKTPRQLGSRFKHPVTGDTIFNPTVDLDLDILPLAQEMPKPADERYYALSDDYTRAPDGTQVLMTWGSTRKSAAPLLKTRLSELHHRAREALEDTDATAIADDLVDYALQWAQANPTGVLWLRRNSGVWVDVSMAQVNTFLANRATRIAAVMSAYKTHDEQIRSMADSEALEALAEYNIESGWPT